MPRLNKLQHNNWDNACKILTKIYELGNYAQVAANACGSKDFVFILDGLLSGIHEAKLEIIDIVENDDKDEVTEGIGDE